MEKDHLTGSLAHAFYRMAETLALKLLRKGWRWICHTFQVVNIANMSPWGRGKSCVMDGLDTHLLSLINMQTLTGEIIVEPQCSFNVRSS